MRRIADDAPMLRFPIRSGKNERRGTRTLATTTNALFAFVVTMGEQNLRRTPPMDDEPPRDEGVGAGEAQRSNAGAPGGLANGGA